MKKNLLKPFLVTLLVIFCRVSVNAQRVENGELLLWDGAAGSIVAIPQIYSLFPILDLFIGVFGTYIAEKYVILHLY